MKYIMTLQEKYQEQLDKYNSYRDQKIAYDTRMQETLLRVNKGEEEIYKNLKSLPPQTLEIIKEIIPIQEPSTAENIFTRRAAWRQVYATLEKYGYDLLRQEV